MGAEVVTGAFVLQVSRGETIPVRLQATETKLKAFLSPCKKAEEQNETTEDKE